MNFSFTFDHSLLSMTELHQAGIRSTRWLEEVFEDEDSQFTDVSMPDMKYPMYISIGFSKDSKPIKYGFEVINDVIVSGYARLATKEEIKNEFCPFCLK